MTQPPRAPVPQEVAAQQQIRRLLQGLFVDGSIRPQLWWDVTENRYAVVIPSDSPLSAGVTSRLPWNILGIPVRVVPIPPHAATGTGSFPGPTLVNGMTTPSLSQGVGIGWPVITISGRRPPQGVGRSGVLQPRSVGSYCGPARFPRGRYHDSWPPVEVVPPWANCPRHRLVY